MSHDQHPSRSYGFAPGNNGIVLTKHGRNFYSPQLFHKSLYFDKIVPVRIRDLVNSADLMKLYGPSALSLINQKIIIINNHPIRYVSITGRILGQYKKIFEEKYYDDEDSVKEPLYFLYLCDSSGTAISCVIPQYKFVGAGLHTDENANDGTLIKVVGMVNHFVNINSLGSTRSKEITTMEIEILAKKDSRSMLVELEEWKKTIQFRDSHLSKPWEVSMNDKQSDDEHYIDIDSLSIKNNVLVSKRANPQYAQGLNMKLLDISSYKYDDEILDIPPDSLALDREIHIKHRKIDSQSVELQEVIDILSQEYGNEVNVMETKIMESYQEKTTIDVPATAIEVIVSSGEDSDIEELPDDTDEVMQDSKSEIILSDSDDHLVIGDNELRGNVPIADELRENIPHINTKRKQRVRNSHTMKPSIDTTTIIIADEDEITETLPNPVKVIPHPPPPSPPPPFKHHFSSLSMENLQEILQLNNIAESLANNIFFVRSLIFDHQNIINRFTFAVEFIKFFINLKQNGKELSNMNHQQIDETKLGNLVGMFSIDLKIVYKHPIIFNFLTLLVLKINYIIVFNRDNNGSTDVLDIFERNESVNDQQKFSEVLDSLKSKDIAKLLNSKEFNLYKSKIFHNIRQEFTGKKLVRGYKIESEMARCRKRRQKVQNIYINFDKICTLHKVIIRELKRYLKESYTFYFEQVSELISLIIRSHGKSDDNEKIARILLTNKYLSTMETYKKNLTSDFIQKCLESLFQRRLEIPMVGNMVSQKSVKDGMIYILDQLIRFTIFETTILETFENDLIENFLKRSMYCGKDRDRDSKATIETTDDLKKVINFKKLRWSFGENSEGSYWMLSL
ncbi:hypothetical protein DASC09_059040 [Saccharomycopsis crataegensis]|uniref:CST complex subunit Stn1 N-terminal domain-containing protein n=1 Tax=Saccharomycopsis crataegensis TaxID=43959 RepID=A0AAV5QVE1_9ASCO|nr:hypothetical protein DASC09_059040 [Saccharomycopsis crataegensis]